MAFILLRIASVKWIEPFLQRHSRASALDRLLDEKSVRGKLAGISLGLGIIALPWVGPEVFRFFDPTFYHPPEKIAWARLTLSVLGGVVVSIAAIGLWGLSRSNRSRHGKCAGVLACGQGWRPALPLQP